MQRSILFSLTTVFFALVGLSIAGQKLPIAKKKTRDIPNEFLKLYQEIDESLNQATQMFPLKKGKSSPLFAPELYFAGSGMELFQQIHNIGRIYVLRSMHSRN